MTDNRHTTAHPVNPSALQR